MTESREMLTAVGGAMSTRSWWTVGVTLFWLPFLVALGVSMWRTPFPVSETVAMLEDVSNAHHSVFDPTARAWYRPLYFLTWDWLWRASGSLPRMLEHFKAIEVAAPLALILLFIRHLRPRTLLEAAAAGGAVAVLVGTPGFRVNLEIPLMMTLFVMPLTMIIWMLLTREPRGWHAVVVVLLTLISIGFKEQGLVIAPVVVIAWWTRAPGAGPRLTLAVVMLSVAYIVFRLSYSSNWPVFEQSMGLWFQQVEPREAIARWGAFPYWMYAYNAISTVLNVLFSEPSDGYFYFAQDVVLNRVDARGVVNVISSLALTATIGWWTIRVVPGLGRQGWTPESRVAAVFVAALLACGVLSIKYSRDREGGMAVVFYALAAYEAVRYAAARALTDGVSARRFALTAGLLAAMTLTWHVRAVATLEWTRRQSEVNVRDWVVQMGPRLERFKDRPVYLNLMTRMIPQGTSPDATRRTNYPVFVQHLLGIYAE